MKTITVFGSSLPVETDLEYQNALYFGDKLAASGFNICTGGFGGVMEAVSRGASKYKVDVIGVTIDLFGAKANNYVKKEIRKKTLLERIETLIDTGDAFLVLPGGTGTLLELSAVWEMLNKKLIKHKPVFCFGKMWIPLVETMEKRIKLEQRRTGLVSCFTDKKLLLESLFTSLKNQ